MDTYTITFFIQTRNAEFEKTIYEIVEAGDVLNADTLNSLFLSLQKKYRGDVIDLIEEAYNEFGSTLGYRWMTVPHFYYNFYLFQYATSMVAANRLASDILAGKPGALEKYMEFLHSGSRYDPVTTLLNVGVDMNSTELIEDFLEEYASLVAEMDQLMRSEGLLDEPDTGLTSIINDYGIWVFCGIIALIIAAWLIYLYVLKKRHIKIGINLIV